MDYPVLESLQRGDVYTLEAEEVWTDPFLESLQTGDVCCMEAEEVWTIHSWSLSREVMSILWNLAKCGHTDILSKDEGAFEAAATRVALAATVNVD